jgi:hypothetical protein
MRRYAIPITPLVGERELGASYVRAPEFPGASVAIMLLDCTPDNVFVDARRLSCIDPWEQATYLGHPAVSIGQFVTLARDVYALDGSVNGGASLEQFMSDELPGVLGL